MRKIRVLSCFDGMSCGQIALKQLGHEVEYYASEIDKFAIEQSKFAFPNMIHLGDVTKWREWEVDFSSIDLVLAGSPCQGFSRAGKGLNFDDPRSRLFFVFVDIYRHILKLNPKVKFLLENVDMDKWCLGVISRELGVYPVNINSNLVSAQNRNRWYWTNIRTRQEGLFREVHTDIPQPKDKKIYLKDILQPEEEIPEKYYIKNIKANFDGMDINGKGNTLRTGGSRSQSDKHNYDLVKIDKKGNVKADQDKASCFTAGVTSGGNHSDMDLFCVRMVGRKILDGKRADNNEDVPTVQRVERVKEYGKTNCLTTVGKDNLIFVGAINGDELAHGGGMFTENYFQYDISGKGYKSQQDRAFYIDGKHGALGAARAETKTGVFLSQRPRGNNKGVDYKIRRLTPLEASRLQTIPEWYLWNPKTSDSQIYRMLGNGWTVAVIEHILSFL